MKKRVFSIIFCLAVLTADCGTAWCISAAGAKPVRLNAGGKMLKPGKIYQLRVKKQKRIIIKQITFRKKGAAVSVSKKGKVTAKKPGKATVICKVKYKQKGKKKIYRKTLKCKITVLDGSKAANPAPGAAETPGALPDITAQPTAAASSTQPSAIPPTETPAPVQSPGEVEKAFRLIRDMGLGINLGNTMEAFGDYIDGSSVSDYELAWQLEKNLITADMIQGMRDAGFKTLRIPVAWSNMMPDDGKYTINEAYFNRVDQIIGYALDAGMYPIVNIHFDGGWWARFGSKDAAERQEAMKKYKTIWTQLADHYKEYPDMLILESANEELGTRLNSTDDYVNSGYYKSEDDLYKLTNEINQIFVDIVRASGGRNADRYLLIAGYDTDITKTCDSRFELPADTVPGHLIVSVHYYDPPTYCIAGDPKNSWGYRDSWGTDEDIKKMQAGLSKLESCFTSQGVPVIIGEYGVASVEGTNERKEGRDLFFRNVCEYSLHHGICPVLWDTGFVYRRSTVSMFNAKEAADYLELAAKAEAMEAFVPEAKAEARDAFMPEAEDGSPSELSACLPARLFILNRFPYVPFSRQR